MLVKPAAEKPCSYEAAEAFVKKLQSMTKRRPAAWETRTVNGKKKRVAAEWTHETIARYPNARLEGFAKPSLPPVKKRKAAAAT